MKLCFNRTLAWYYSMNDAWLAQDFQCGAQITPSSSIKWRTNNTQFSWYNFLNIIIRKQFKTPTNSHPILPWPWIFAVESILKESCMDTLSAQPHPLLRVTFSGNHAHCSEFQIWPLVTFDHKLWVKWLLTSWRGRAWVLDGPSAANYPPILRNLLSIFTSPSFSATEDVQTQTHYAWLFAFVGLLDRSTSWTKTPDCIAAKEQKLQNIHELNAGFILVSPSPALSHLNVGLHIHGMSKDFRRGW